MMGHKECFYEEMGLIIPKISLTPSYLDHCIMRVTQILFLKGRFPEFQIITILLILSNLPS